MSYFEKIFILPDLSDVATYPLAQTHWLLVQVREPEPLSGHWSLSSQESSMLTAEMDDIFHNCNQ